MKKELKRSIARIIALTVLVTTIFMGTTRVAMAQRDYSLVFDPVYYMTKYTDVLQQCGENKDALLKHFLQYGMAEGRQGCASYNVWTYINNYTDLQQVYGTDVKAYYLHYIDYGKAEGRSGKGDDKSANWIAPSVTTTPAAVTPTTAPSDAGKQPVSPSTSIGSGLVVDPVKDTGSGVSERRIINYYKNSVFIGDSIMVGFRNYLARHTDNPIAGAQFLAVTSYSALHARADASKDSLQPSYQGKKRNVWDSIAQMGAKHVFIMFGTNDLVVRDAPATYDNIMYVAQKIQEVNPDVDIHFISMTPIWSGAQKKGALNNETIGKLNTLLAAGASDKGYHYVNLQKYLLDEQAALRTAYCSDKYVHLTDTAYEKAWTPVFYNHAIADLKK